MPFQSTIDDERLRPIVESAFRKGRQYKEILAELKALHDFDISLITLKRRLKAWGLHRKKDAIDQGTITVAEVVHLIETEAAANQATGYRRMQQILLHTHGVAVKRATVAVALTATNPEASANRRSGRLVRRQYVSNGPNEAWSMDGHDKLKPYGISMYGYIDGWSRNVLGLHVHSTNNDPRHIGIYYLNLVKEVGGIPTMTVSDAGSETVHVAALQVALKAVAIGNGIDLAAHRHTTSPLNQKIECFWSQLMKQMNISLINNLHEAVETGRYNPARSLQLQVFLYIFVPLIQKFCDDYVKVYNNFRQRKNANSNLPTNVQPEHAYNCPGDYGGINCLIPIDLDLIQEQLDEHYPTRKELLEGYVEAEHRQIFDGLMGDHGLILEQQNLQEAWQLYDELRLLASPILPDDL